MNVSGDSESSESSSSAPCEEKNNLIDKILGEMKNQFNNTERKQTPLDTDMAEDEEQEDVEVEDEETVTDTNLALTETIPSAESSPSLTEVTSDLQETIVKTEDTSTNVVEDTSDTQQKSEDSDKPRIVLLFKKPSPDSASKGKNSTERRSLRQKSNYLAEHAESVLKRSARRRRSKDYAESVLQSAIARKEKSYNESNKPQRLTRQLKPTQKILENLALAQQEKLTTNKSPKGKNHHDSDSYTETDVKSEENGEQVHRKHKYKHNKHLKKSKRFKSSHIMEVGKDSDSDLSEENLKRGEDAGHRRSRRISSSRFKEEVVEGEDHSLQESIAGEEPSICFNGVQSSSVSEELIASRLCLCMQKTQYYLAPNDTEITYCGAIDSVDEKLVGCSKVVDIQETMMLRPSTRIPYVLLCETHRNRLIRHNCCPTCGIFCTQGSFTECEAKHQYHRDCQISVGSHECCPHCGLATPNYDVVITMHSAKRPIFLPVQKPQYVSAKMTFQTNCKLENEEPEVKCVTPPLIPNEALDILNSTDYQHEEYEISDLITAINNNDIEKVAGIIGSKSVDVATSGLPQCNEGTVLHLASQNGLLPIVHMLLISGLQPDVFNKDQNTPLMLAILSEKNDVVRYLVRIGASTDLKGTDGMTALHLASKCGNIKACELLLNHSNVKSYINGRDDGGWTPLVWACEHGYANIANFLINKGADISARDVEYNVSLHWAAFSGNSHIAELLLNKGCDVNTVNAHGDTPLHIGARQDMYNCIIVLLARGADVTLLNKNNESPLDCVPPGGDCYNPISLNITLQASADYDCPNVILVNDISKGKELNPIQCFNNVDTEPNPTNFKYIIKNCVTSDDIKIDTKINTMQSCNCEERCVGDGCLCGKSSLRCWYDEEGKLIPEFNFNDMPMIFECNDGCSCNAITCNNRVVQKGLTHRFELFKTVDKGWGIRALRHVPQGSFVCEYVGEIITEVEADKREDDSFLFDLENRVCKSINESDSYCIDSKFYGNFTRFINHSCSPNLTPVKVFTDHQDLRFPRVIFFANRDIAGDEELSFDYGEKFWLAKYKSMTCLCGSPECRYSEDVIEDTMQNYQRRLEECS